MSKRTRLVTGLVVLTIGMLLPSLLARALDHPVIAAAIFMPVMAGMLPTVLGGARIALISVPVLVVACGLAVVGHGNAILAGVVMGATSLAFGLSCRSGANKFLVMVPITVGFIVCVPPNLATDVTANVGFVALVTLVGSLWGVGLGWVVTRRSTHQSPEPEAWSRTWAYAITLALLTGLAAAISIATNWGHAGGWFVLTVVIVFQPYLRVAAQKTFQRAGGTVVGVGIALVIDFVVPWTPVKAIIGAALFPIAIVILIKPQYPYWAYTAVLTPGIVLLEGAATSIAITAGSRLAATFAGVALSLVAVVVLAPLYRHYTGGAPDTAAPNRSDADPAAAQ